MSKPRTLLSRLFWSIAIPEFVIFTFIGLFTYYELTNVLNASHSQQSKSVKAEILQLLDMTDVGMVFIENNLDDQLEKGSAAIRNEFFSTTEGIEQADLSGIRSTLGFDEEKADLYIINKQGVIVNTTFEKDLGIDVSDFGTDFINFFNSVLASDSFITESFALEMNTFKLKKYTYQATNDKEYMIQFGVYSDEATTLFNTSREIAHSIVNQYSEIRSIDLFISSNNPFSLISTVNKLPEWKKTRLKELFKANMDSLVSEENVNDSTIFEHILLKRNTGLYQSLIIEIERDPRYQAAVLEQNVVKESLLFVIGLLSLFVILWFNSKLITKPIIHVSETAKKVGEGNLNLQVPVSGTRELVSMSEAFNQMTLNLKESDQKIRAQKEEIEESHREIRDSINYARRIQEAILPPTKLVKEYLTESFILYKPKDVVAGDFYWFDVQGDDIFFAAADCTGHGVPGAMVSVVCSNALNRAVNEMNLSEPAMILDKVRELVVETFEKSEEDVKDGMDISFCKLNLNTRKLSFAGANNPLYRISPKAGEIGEKTLVKDTHMLLEYKGDKQPIGKFAFEKPFTQQEIQLLAGDSIYLSTDGYPDQFGGEKGRKFMYKPFKKLLLDLHLDAMDKQKATLNERFEAWRGSEEQVDDVCVIGVRV